MPRAIWSGTISFGLVSVPVRMYTATESKELRFHFLTKGDLQPIGYDKVRKDTGEHVDPDEIVRGFEIEKGRYVELTDEDIDRLAQLAPARFLTAPGLWLGLLAAAAFLVAAARLRRKREPI